MTNYLTRLGKNKSESQKWFELFIMITKKESETALSAEGLRNQIIGLCKQMIKIEDDETNSI